MEYDDDVLIEYIVTQHNHNEIVFSEVLLANVFVFGQSETIVQTKRRH